MEQLTQNEMKAIKGLHKANMTLLVISPYISIGAQTVFTYVAAHPGCTMGDIIKETGYSQASISRYIHDLSDMGRMKNASERAKGLRLLDVKVNPMNLRERLLYVSIPGASLARELIDCMH